MTRRPRDLPHFANLRQPQRRRLSFTDWAAIAVTAVLALTVARTLHITLLNLQ